MPTEKALIDDFGANWVIKLAPKDKVTIAINGVIGKEFEVPNYAKCQIKWWLDYQK